MCKYCDRNIIKEPLIEHLSDGCLMESAAIIAPTPISLRKRADYPATLQVAIFSETVDIPIKYCPMCGKEIK